MPDNDGGVVLNCASGSCCHPAAAKQATAKILCEQLECDAQEAERIMFKMWQAGLRFYPARIVEAIADFIDHPNHRE
jgi:hypothetical protein